MSKYTGKFDLLDELTMKGITDDNGNLLMDPKRINRRVKVTVNYEPVEIVTGHELAPFYTHVPTCISKDGNKTFINVFPDNFFDEECRRVVNRDVKTEIKAIRRFRKLNGTLKPKFSDLHTGKYPKDSIWRQLFKASYLQETKSIPVNVDSMLPLWCPTLRKIAAEMLATHGYPLPMAKKWFKVEV